MPAGRPTDYNDEIADKICERILTGESVNKISQDPDMPSKKTIFLWLSKHQEFSDKYAHAKEIGIEALADELLEITDDSRNDWMEREDPDNPGYQFNGEHVQRTRLRVDTRKWLLSKLGRKKYGDSVAHTGPNDGPIQHKITSVTFTGPDE